MKRTIVYCYNSWTEACGCCSNSSSTYDVYEDGICIAEDNWCDLCCNEDELREVLNYLEPFDVDPDSWWFWWRILNESLLR